MATLKTMTTFNQQKETLKSRLVDLLGADAVIVDSEVLHLLSTDVYASGPIAALAVCPRDRQDVPRVVQLIGEHGFSVIPRGGGLSYTGGYTPDHMKSVIVDLRRLDKIIELSESDMIITVEAGVTWKQIYVALAPLGLRLPFFGTFSGALATVGGGMSNGALFLGSARYGSAADMALGLEVVLASGEVVKTGQAAFANGVSFYRTYGPDLTGLFLHDAGALGVKTLITMRLIRAPTVTDAASFVFADMACAAHALSVVGRSGLCEDAYVFDPETTRNNLQGSDLQKSAGRLAKVIVTGKDDEVCDWQLAQKFSTALNISIVVLDGEGHMISPEKVSQAVDSFLLRQ
jgi:FAD/FMN-containing dehydrogenase